MENIFIENWKHLGDILTVLNLGYSRVIENGSQLKIYGPQYITELFELFDYTGITYEGSSPNHFPITTHLIDLMPKYPAGQNLSNNRCSVEFLAHNSVKFDSAPGVKQITKITLPELKVFPTKKEQTVCIQFDTRSPHVGKSILSQKESNIIIEKFCNDLIVVGVGGHDTKPYFKDYEFRLGRLSHILQNLLNCTKFVGVDSGISHLAGTAKIPGDVIVLHSRELQYRELVSFYKNLYPSLTCYRRPVVNYVI